MNQTKGKTLEQIDLLFTGPKVLIDISEEELLAMQERHIEKAVHNEYSLKGDKGFDGAAHVEVV